MRFAVIDTTGQAKVGRPSVYMLEMYDESKHACVVLFVSVCVFG